jgi:hypothetical protein
MKIRGWALALLPILAAVPAEAKLMRVSADNVRTIYLDLGRVQTQGDCRIVRVLLRYRSPRAEDFGPVAAVVEYLRLCCRAGTYQPIRRAYYAPGQRLLRRFRLEGTVRSVRPRTGAARIQRAICGLPAGPPGPAYQAPVGRPVVVGYMEYARVFPGNLYFRALMDTGATHSSLIVGRISFFARHGRQWVRATVTDANGRRATLIRPPLKMVTVTVGSGHKSRRPVIGLGVCVAGIYRVVPVTLVVRRADYREMLVGRSFMNGRILVDSGQRYRTSPRCLRR